MTQKTILAARARVLGVCGAMALCLSGMWATAAQADFGLGAFDNQITANAAGDPFTQAAGHPYAIKTSFNFNLLPGGPSAGPDEEVRDVLVGLPAGFVGNPTVLPECEEADLQGDSCNLDTQVGIVEAILSDPSNPSGESVQIKPIFNMIPAANAPASFGFNIGGLTVPHLNARLDAEGGYRLWVDTKSISQLQPITAITTTFWGVPSAPSHDAERGLGCGGQVGKLTCSGGGHASTLMPAPFLTNPSNCAAGPFETSVEMRSWTDPNVWKDYSIVNHLPPAYPAPQADWGAPQGATGCEFVGFAPDLEAQATNTQAESPTGLNVDLTIPQDQNPDGLASAYLKKAVVKLPEGVSVNPSAGEGLGVCTPAEFARETATSAPGAGCPNASKVGTVSATTPLLREEGVGSLFIAQQDNPKTSAPGAENPFDSLLALYVVLKIPERGILVKVAGKVAPNPRTGQLETTFDNLPQLPFDRFTLGFREGQRSPLSTPPACGSYETKAEFVPWSAADPNNPAPGEIVHTTSTFTIDKGPGGGACPASSGQRPFAPGLQAGTLNNNAGSYSPFNVRMTRNDGEQEITSFSADLPKGLIGKLAGVPSCSDADIAKAASKTGTEENANPSCPAASQIGKTLAGAGVGSVLAYAPGKVFLAGPYHGSPLSIAAITSATVGPFDLGTVVVRSALRVDPTTAQVSVDSAGSDPIPHILEGIPLHLRDIRVYVDRPDFVLNPTSCNPFAVKTRLTGSGADFANPADDVGANASQPFQAANCANLGFKPKLTFKLKGGTHRGDYPALSATLTARKGDANIARTAVTLPHSEFLAQEHIRTICTRVQFAADACPAASIYGKARATTPLLDEALEGPVYLRSSSNPLPDLVADLDGRFNVVLSGRIDSVNQGIRNTFDVVPDAPVTKFTLSMQGGKKGLLVNSRNLCKGVNRAEVKMVGQNGKTSLTKPVVTNACKKKKARKGKKSKRSVKR